MHPKHVLDYIEYRLPRIQEKYDINKAEYDKYKAEYEAKWYNKLFGSKYTGLWDFWDWFYFARLIKELKKIKCEAEYKYKMEYPRMEIPESWQDGFYKWASENKIPF